MYFIKCGKRRLFQNASGNQSLLSPDTEIFKKAVFYRQGRCRTGDDAGIHFNYSQNELFPQPPENVSALLTKGCIADFVSYARRIHRTQK